MKIRKYFYKDKNYKLMGIQEDYFKSLANHIYIYDKNRYIKSVELIGARTF